MRIPSFLDSSYHRPGHPETADAVVSGDLVGDGAKEWSQRPGAAADSGFTQLHDGLDVAAQGAPGDGATWARTTQRARRGRRDLCRGIGGGGSWPPYGDKGFGGNRL